MITGLLAGLVMGCGTTLWKDASGNALISTDTSIRPESQTVLVARTLQDVNGCKHVGQIHAQASFLSMVLSNGYSTAGTSNDILRDAKNKAIAKGANRILAANNPTGESQDFDAFSCSG